MAGIKEKEVVTPQLPKIKITRKPSLRLIKPVKVRREARRAMGKTEANATKVAQSFVNHFITALNKTPEGKKFLATKVKKSEIGNLLFG